MPADIHLGEAAGVATNSKGHIFRLHAHRQSDRRRSATRALFTHGGSRLFQFDQNGKFVREIGAGRLRLRLRARGARRRAGQHLGRRRGREPGRQVRSRRPRADGAGPQAGSDHRAAAACRAATAGAWRRRVAAAAAAVGAAAALPGAGGAGDQFNRPSDVAWDADGNIFVADGHGANARVAKFDKNGRFITSWGSRGTEPGQFNTPHSIAIDAQGNVYVADQGNKRIQVFDNDGTFKAQIANVGVPTAICITRGPHQYLYSSHTGDPVRHGRRGDLQAGARRPRSSASSARPASCRRSSASSTRIDCRERERAVRRRADELARAEADAGPDRVALTDCTFRLKAEATRRFQGGR